MAEVGVGREFLQAVVSVDAHVVRVRHIVRLQAVRCSHAPILDELVAHVQLKQKENGEYW